MCTEWDESEGVLAYDYAAFRNMLGSGLPWDGANLDDLRARLGSALGRLIEEAMWTAAPCKPALEEEIDLFAQDADELLGGMNPYEAEIWLGMHLGAIERLRARTERERGNALLVLQGGRANLVYTAYHLKSDEGTATATTEGPSVPSWDEAETRVAAAHAAHDDDDDDDDDEGGDGDDEGGFCAPAVREIVQAYRATAMKQRDLLLARLRNSAARLGAEAACFASWDPDEKGLNADIGRFIARAEFCLRGICPIDAAAWLEGNVGELEGLHARNRSEYEQAGLALSGLNDRLFGLLYDLARER